MRSTDGSTYTKVIDIKDFPDLGGTPETIDTTTLTDAMRTSVLGIQEAENFVFNANYDPAQFNSLVALATADEAAPNYYAVWFGGTDNAVGDPTPTGELGKFVFKGTMAKPFVSGGGVNEARSIQITIAPATPVSFVYSGGLSITLDKGEVSIVDGNTASLVATATDGATVKWSSSDTSVATVSSGTVTAVDPGNAIITATAEKSGDMVYATCLVTVTAS